MVMKIMIVQYALITGFMLPFFFFNEKNVHCLSKISKASMLLPAPKSMVFLLQFQKPLPRYELCLAPYIGNC